MTVEDVINSLTNVYWECNDNNISLVLFVLGVVAFIIYLVLFIKERLLTRPVCVIAMVACVFGCAFLLSLYAKLPTLFTLKAEIDPDVIAQEQVEEYFALYDVVWVNGKISCRLHPKSNAYDEVLDYWENFKKG